MPSIRYFNQTAPFWDFVANFESSGGDHPFFAAYNHQSFEEGRAAPPPAQDANTGNSASQEAGPNPAQDRDNSEQPRHQPHPHEHPFGPGFPFGGHRGGPHHRGGFRRFRSGSRCGAGPSSCRGPPGFGWNMGGPGGPAFDWSKIAEFFASQFGPDATRSENDSPNNKDFAPPADVFDTEDAYIVHVSLPGAKKEDVGVNWDADKSELSVAGVIYRPGDEDFVKTLALDERQVGVFERKVRLGSRASPAQVDADGISAKMEDGVLMVSIPKLDREYVDVKKVDIE